MKPLYFCWILGLTLSFSAGEVVELKIQTHDVERVDQDTDFRAEASTDLGTYRKSHLANNDDAITIPRDPSQTDTQEEETAIPGGSSLTERDENTARQSSLLVEDDFGISELETILLKKWLLMELFAMEGLENPFKCKKEDENTFGCCVEKKFFITLSACIKLTAETDGFLIKMEVLGQELYHKKIPVGDTKEFCAKKKKVEICGQLVDFNPAERSACLKVKAKLWHFHEDVKQCFTFGPAPAPPPPPPPPQRY